MYSTIDESIPVRFPGLGLSFPLHMDAFSIGGLTVRWYGILIAGGLLLALFYAFRSCRKFNIKDDDLTDVTIISLVAGIVGARLYYVIFYDTQGGTNPYFADPLSILQIWNGGLGIYGGVIGAFLAAFFVCRKKKISVGAMFDLAAPGFLIGQGIGRWGNFFNREAYGAATNAIWRMTGVNADNMTQGYQPTFFFESVWCIIGFFVLYRYAKHRKFNGELFLFYIMWYGFERFFIEGLRTDSLMLGNIRISQLVAAVSFIAALCIIVRRRLKLRDQKRETQTPYTPLFAEAARALGDGEPTVTAAPGTQAEAPAGTAAAGTADTHTENTAAPQPDETGGDNKNSQKGD